MDNGNGACVGTADAVGGETPVTEPAPMLEIPVGPVCLTVKVELVNGYGAVGGPLVLEVGRDPDENTVSVTAPDVEFEIGNGGSIEVGVGSRDPVPKEVEPVKVPVGAFTVVFDSGYGAETGE